VREDLESTISAFVIQVTARDTHWTVSHTYRDFLALRLFILSETHNGVQASALPSFPPRSFIEAPNTPVRDITCALQTYLAALAAGGGFGLSNVIDAISSFLELPEHVDQMGRERRSASASRSFDDDDDCLVEDPTKGITVCNVVKGVNITVLTIRLEELFSKSCCLIWDTATNGVWKDELVDLHILSSRTELLDWLQDEWRSWIGGWISDISNIVEYEKPFGEKVWEDESIPSLKKSFRAAFHYSMYKSNPRNNSVGYDPQSRNGTDRDESDEHFPSSHIRETSPDCGLF